MAGHSSQGGRGNHDPKPKPFSRLFNLLALEWSDISALIIYCVAVAILSLATPIAVEALVNTVAFGVLLWPVIAISLILMSCLGLAAAIRAMQVFVVECLQRRLFTRVVADYANRFPALRLDNFDHRSGPELANRFFDVLTLQKSISTLLLDGLAMVIMTFIGLLVLASYHPFLLGFDIVLVLLVSFLVLVLGWGGVRTSLDESHAKYDVAGWLEEVLRCHRLFKSSGGKQWSLDRADALASHYLDARKQHFSVIWRQTVFGMSTQVVASSALLGLGGWLVITRQLTLGQLVAAEMIVSLVVSSVSKMGKYAETWYDLLSSTEKIGLVTDLPLDRSGGEPLPDCESGLSLRVIRPDSQPWSMAPGEKIALTGPARSGKTRLMEVFCGMREPDGFVVEADGIDIRNLSLDSIREHTALVGEGTGLVQGTVLENLRMGRAHVPLPAVVSALEMVGLRDAVQRLPHGLDTLVVPGGSPFSNIQETLLTIARAIAGKPRLLAIDRVLDGLDSASLQTVLRAVAAPGVSWTLLLGTNRDEVMVRCDQIMTLRGGIGDIGQSHSHGNESLAGGLAP